MYNDSVAEVFIILEASRSCGNIHCSYQHYQPGKITLQVSVLIIDYLVATSYQLWMMYFVIVVKVLDSQSRGPVFKTTGWLQGRLRLSSFRGG